MATDEHQDWIDRTLARSAWEPPAGFTDRIVVRAMASLPNARPTQAPQLGRWGRILAAIMGIRDTLLARLEGAVWILAQYRELLLR